MENSLITPDKQNPLHPNPPILCCERLQIYVPVVLLPTDWDQIASDFKGFSHCHLSQAWLPELESGFQSAKVSVAWGEKLLWVYAELSGEDIYNSADGLNQNTWETGNNFEIFLRPEGSETYFEFHVTPENHILQLRWPGADALSGSLEESENPLKPFLLSPRRIQSWTRVNHQQNKWSVLVSLDWQLLERCPIEGEIWAFSFSRYDVSRQKGTTILSSSSPHRFPGFHRQHEWGTLIFKSNS